MRARLAQLSIAVLLACGAASGAHAQNRTDANANTAVLPVFNKASNKVEAYLLLEPAADGTRTGARWRFGGSNELDAAFGLEAGDSLALLCDRKNGVTGALASLAGSCVIGAVGDNIDGSSRRTSATAAFSRESGKVGLTAGSGRADLPAWLTPNAGRVGSGNVDINDLTVFAQKDIGNKGTVSIAGTIAQAELIPAGDAPATLSDHWDSKSLRIGGSYGDFGASVVGHVVNTPGQEQWQGLGVGLTWRTPWRGQLTVGADNLVTRGKNPFSPNTDTDDEGAVPYVRYEQDL